ncbi:sulfite exporter TauE/SafE family protein [Agathobaculum butyriciproducens]|nr:sulfite exporter TauE/SafE family protein [Agathobaculum butyriciproducens]RGC60161.1 sulfite exporter TauE/SafE family protein [Agathobaculum butyriciproducens]
MAAPRVRRADSLRRRPCRPAAVSAVLAVAIGLLTGILSGFGIGGGSLLLLYLTLFEGTGQYQAGGINLLYFLSCAPAALISHRKNGLIEREAVKCCVPTGVVTSVLSALLAARVDTDLLRRAFGVVLLYIGVKETFLRKNNTFLTKCEEGVQLSKEWIFLSLHPIRAVARVK